MAERKIGIVNDNMDKRYTYAEHIGRYNRAIKYEFYFEAMLIDYALMEDRLKSFLYHAGLIETRISTSIDINEKHLNYIRKIYRDSCKKNNVNIPHIGNISGKRKIITAVLNWTNSTTEIPDNNQYLKALKNQCESIDIGDMLGTLDQIKEWCKYRDEVVHALMHKNIDSLNAELCDKAIEGMQIAKKLDTFIRDIKKGNKVRKSANMHIDK